MNRTQLGTALRALRQASAKEAKVVARSAVMSASKLSKIETGKVAPTIVDVERILTAIGVSDEVKAEYMAAARAEATEATAWRLVRRLGHHRKQQQIKALDDSTGLLCVFQPSIVPGLLQTPEYVRAVFGRKGLGEEQLSRSIAARLARQSTLYDSAKSLRFVITEPVLRWRLLPAAMMAGQLDRIVSASRMSHVDIRVVPLAAPQTDAPAHAFVIRDSRMVTVETVHAELAVTDPRDVEVYVRKFDTFAAGALAGDAMRSLLERIRDVFLSEQGSAS
ncbi:helix-turn-helix transcriptional regulator [Kitasatospora purpeofusca]|uniref:Helix-turn-helix domain-containing protein n=1 Tax=Kitasatospora purpeofusca TaxID=67352 RepID=A0ABZ1TZB9_9ACTN|nr:helix-turn-helix transcriptional regulator [Kitasatospora purpeofusca]WTA53683.1 helix-turn-helix domain-containing protein [Kitasatospora purpeofusca]